MTRSILAPLLAAHLVSPSLSYADTATPDAGSVIFPSFDLVETEIVTSGDTAVFRSRVRGEAGVDIPDATGQFAGSEVFAYVWPTDLDSADIGFDEGQGIVALAVTFHPDFDDAAHGGVNRHIWHPHWVVLASDDDCGAGLKVIDIPEGATPRVPPTWPGVPLLIDSPDYATGFQGDTVEVNVPLDLIGGRVVASGDGITAGLKINSNLHAPLLCVDSSPLVSASASAVPAPRVSPAATEPPARRDAPPCAAACAATLSKTVGDITYAYRSLGTQGEPPLVLLNRFRGTMDEWDPAFLDRLSTARHVIVFDNVGVARTDGNSPERLVGWAEGAAAFIEALGYNQVDLLGFSFGGLVAQELTLQRPDLVRRLVIVGSGAGYVEGANLSERAIEVATRPVNSDEDFLYLFFRDTPTSQAAGRAHLARLRERADAFDRVVSRESWMAMLSAGSDVGTAETSLLTRVGDITQPVLIANGVEDVMIPTYQSFALAQAMPNARLVIYPDSGHAFMFQFPEAFGDDVIRFLSDPA